MSGEIGYINTTDADLYFSTRLSSDAWTSIPADSTFAKKIAALTTAYDRLFYSGLFNLPTFAAATAAQLVVLQKAQCELSLYMLIHLADEDRRKGLHAQGVVGANIVGETYVRFASDTMDLKDLPIPPMVAHMLKAAGFSAAPAPFYVSDIDRDEDKGANEDVTDY